MKAEGLRIGNLFKEKYSGKIIKVIELREGETTFEGSFYGEWQAEPIPLKEEILLNCYCDNVVHRGFYHVFNDIEVALLSDDFLEGFYTLKLGIYTQKISYLHELQNWYYIVNKKELNVKL